MYYYANDYKNTRTGLSLPKGVNTGTYATDSYNGQIKAMTWFTQKPQSVTGLDAPTTNVFKYDDKYRYTENTWGTTLNFANNPASFTATTYNKETVKDPVTPANYGYDSHGNILYLQRTNATGTLVDKFQYTYKANSNQLASVANSATGTSAPYASYTYDSLGQMTVENNADTGKIKYLRYDVTGKVTAVAKDAAFTRLVAEFVYDENGARIAKKSYNPSTGVLLQTTWYVGGMIYVQLNGGSAVPEEYAIDAGGDRLGTFYKQDNVYAYELRDQLGNVRATIAQSGTSLEVRGYSDYYPYGMVLRSGGTTYRYGYQGAYAEKDGETDWNAFELRMYDSRIARWLTTDPAGQFASPYIAMGGDPVNNMDKDGGEAHEDPKEGDVRVNNTTRDGQIFQDNNWVDATSAPTVYLDPVKTKLQANSTWGTMSNLSDPLQNNGWSNNEISDFLNTHYKLNYYDMKNLNYALSTYSYRTAYNTVGVDAIKPLGYMFGGAMAAPFAAEATVAAIPSVLSEASLLRYTPQSVVNMLKLFGGNMAIQVAFNGRNANVYGAAAATANPWLGLSGSFISYTPFNGNTKGTLGWSTDFSMKSWQNFGVSAIFTTLQVSFGVAVPNNPNSATVEYILGAADAGAQKAGQNLYNK